MLLSKKKFTFERKKSENKENDLNNNQHKQNESEFKINNKYHSNKNLIIKDSILTKKKEENTSEKENSFNEKQNLTDNQINLDNFKQYNFSSNPELQYLINRNEDEDIDFINTLLKLKGIQTNQLKKYKSSKNIDIKPKIKEENNLLHKSKKKVMIRNKKNNQSNSSNQTTKINSTMNNNNQLNENEDEETPKDQRNISYLTSDNNLKIEKYNDEVNKPNNNTKVIQTNKIQCESPYIIFT